MVGPLANRVLRHWSPVASGLSALSKLVCVPHGAGMADASRTSLTTPVIEARNLSKVFGEVEAVRDLSFTVDAGEIFGLLGPNGAGKSTVIRMLTTLISVDSGSGIVGSFDVRSHPNAVRQMIGLAGQAAAIDEKLSARENLELFGRLYKSPERPATTTN